MASTSAIPTPSFATALANVRRLTSSTQAHQSKPAQLLQAIETTISSALKSSTLPHSPTAYFASLLQCLEKACADEVGNGDDEAMAESENMGAGALIPATVYLLAMVVPETPTQVVLSKLSPLLECLLPLFDTALAHPPALRSILQITTSVLLIAPPALLNSSPLLKKSWAYLLELNLDPRPKVRHLAQEGVRKVLCTPVPPRVTPGAHPYLPKARDWVAGVLEEEVRNGGTSSKGKKARFADGEDSEGKRAIWVVQGLRGWVAVWGDEHISALCSILLSLPPIPHLTSQIYSLLSHLLSPPPADTSAAKPSVLTNLPKIIDSLLSSPPEVSSSSADLPEYLSALTSALIKMSLQDPVTLPTYLPRAFSLAFNNILLAPNSSASALTAASDAVGSQGILRYCISDEMILSSVTYSRQGSLLPGARKKQKTPFLSKIIASLSDALNTNALRMPHLLPILTALISRLRLRITAAENAEVDPSGRGKTAAEELVMDLIRDVGDLRTQPGFEEKAKVDDVVGMAIEVVGVEGVLKALPLNIEPDAMGNTPQPGRAHLLPLIRTRTTNDSLSYFQTYFRPLSERIFQRKVAAEEGEKEAEAKIWEVIVGQIWDCLPGFAEMPRDMKQGLTTPFLTLITNLLYTQNLLIPSLLRSLSQLVTSTERLLASSTPSSELKKQFGLDQTSAAENMGLLKSLAKDMVSVLLNVFSKMAREQRGMVGDVIGVWVRIMTEKDIIDTYNTVTSHLSKSIDSTTAPAPGASPIAHTMLDLLIIFIPNLPAAQSAALFTATATPTMLEHKDATVQKKSYRALKRLLEAGRLGEAANGERIEEFVEKMNKVGGGVGPGAQRDRLLLLSALVTALPKDRLHLIPELLSEAVLGTKEVNEKARDAGFDLLVVMAKKMAEGGSVQQLAGPVDDEEMADEGQQGSVEASVEEYITMVAAGLTGNTPHMISASINAMSRLMFEFKDDISEDMISELVATIVVFVGSKNREIVKSALGFVKVAVVALDASTVAPHLPTLVPALLGWVHDHKNHFKSKTIHIFERMIRKFGYEEVYRYGGEGGQKKVLENIKKRKDRAKRKKDANDDDDGEEPKSKASSGNAFDDILYNSDSELGSDDEDSKPTKSNGRPIKPLSKKERKAQMGNATYIKNEGDEPMDLLSRSIAGGVTSADPSAASRKRKPGQEAAHYKTDKSTGRMIIEDSDNEDSAPTHDARAGSGGAYISAMTSTDGATRDAKGALKFNKNTKRAREAEKEAEAMEMDELINDKDQIREKMKKKAKKEAVRLGEEFRGKRAAGDIKKAGGPDPYSYVSIGQAARNNKTKGNQRVSLTNKKKGSRG